MATDEVTGSQTATLGTEHTLATVNTAGTFVLKVDTSNLANDETLELRIKTKNDSGEAAAVLEFYASFTHAQTMVQKSSLAVVLSANDAAAFTLKQTGGTGRAFPWTIKKL